jgi:hypothetical protein
MSIFPNIFLTTDAQHYGILAQNLINGRGFSLGGTPELIYPPGYPLLLTLPLSFLNPENAVLLLMYLGFAGLVLGSFLLVKKYTNTLIAVLTALFILINGNIILFALLGYAEILMLPFVLFSFYFFDTEDKRKLFLSGLLGGIAYLIKPEALLYIGVFVFIVYLRKHLSVDKKIILFFIPLAILALSYGLFIYKATGKLALSGKIATLEWDKYVEGVADRDSVAYRFNQDGTIGATIGNFSLKGINLFVRALRNLKNFKQAVYELLLPIKIIAVSLLLGFVLEKKYRKLFLAVGFLNLPVLASLLFHIENRYVLPVLISVVFLLSISVSQIFLTKNMKYNLLKIVVSLFSLVTLTVLTHYSYYPIRSTYVDLVKDELATQKFLAENPVEGDVIISRKPIYSFLSRKDYIPFPYTNDPQVLTTFLDHYHNATIILDQWDYYLLPEVHRLILEDFQSGRRQIVKEKQVLVFDNW